MEMKVKLKFEVTILCTVQSTYSVPYDVGMRHTSGHSIYGAAGDATNTTLLFTLLEKRTVAETCWKVRTSLHSHRQEVDAH